MPAYRRLYIPGGTCFFTLVTAGREPIFGDARAVALLRDAVRAERRVRPFSIVAAVVLPDHLHMIWTLPRAESDYSTRWGAIKAGFTRAYLARGGDEARISQGRTRHGYRGVWQPRFIEHTCRDEDDLGRHIDYVHYNPVKHGLVTRPIEWPWSSMHRYVRAGILSSDWPTNRPAEVDGLE